jgi:hypothetical protein
MIGLISAVSQTTMLQSERGRDTTTHARRRTPYGPGCRRLNGLRGSQGMRPSVHNLSGYNRVENDHEEKHPAEGIPFPYQ